MEPNSKYTTNNIIQFLGLVLMLVVFPAGSWFYLQSGLNYQREARAELRSYAKVGDFSLTNQKGESFRNEDFAGKISVVALVPESRPDQFSIIETFTKLNQQFQKRKEIQFLLHLLSNEQNDLARLKAFAAKHRVEEDSAFNILTGTSEQVNRLFKDFYKWPKKANPEDLAAEWQFETDFPLQKTSEYPYFVLVDTVGTIKNYYDARNSKAIKRLVEHIAIIMPKEKQDKAVLNREKEK